MKNIVFTLPFLLLLFSSCTKDELQPQHLDNIFGFTTLEEARNHLGKYADIFSLTNGSMRIRSTTFGVNRNAEGAEIFGRYLEGSNYSSSKNGGDYKLGSIKLSFNEATESYKLEEMLSNDERVHLISNLFGTQNRFSLIRNGSTVLSFLQYIPDKIYVDIKNAVDYPSSSALAISRDRFEITWNRDENNDNGVVVYLWWNGDRTDVFPPEQVSTGPINKAVKLNDSGHANISKELFRDIPKNAIVTLFFIRGNVDIKEIERKSFKFYSVTQNQYALILLD